MKNKSSKELSSSKDPNKNISCLLLKDCSLHFSESLPPLDNQMFLLAYSTSLIVLHCKFLLILILYQIIKNEDGNSESVFCLITLFSENMYFNSLSSKCSLHLHGLLNICLSLHSHISQPFIVEAIYFLYSPMETWQGNRPSTSFQSHLNIIFSFFSSKVPAHLNCMSYVNRNPCLSLLPSSTDLLEVSYLLKISPLGQ